MTLHTVIARHQIGSQRAPAGTVFLIVDVEITNNGAFGHLFDPTLTCLTAREGTDYGRALASVIPIDGADDDGGTLQTGQPLWHYDRALTAQRRGFCHRGGHCCRADAPWEPRLSPRGGQWIVYVCVYQSTYRADDPFHATRLMYWYRTL